MENTAFVSFAELYGMDYEICDIYVVRQTWQDGILYRKDHPRKCNGLIFLNGCTGEYTDRRGQAFHAPCKSLVCLPYQSEYAVLNIASSLHAPDAYLVEFNLRSGDRYLSFAEHPFLIPVEDAFTVQQMAEELAAEYEQLVRSPAALKMGIYRLLVSLGREAMKESATSHRQLSPAIDHMEKNPDTPLSVEELAAMCHLSSGGFRRLFRAYTGQSPVKYMIEKRMLYAKKMLENSSMSVEKIAEQLSFESSSYFCKLFKKTVGMTPTEYRQSH